jgi:hypothetical protein
VRPIWGWWGGERGGDTLASSSSLAAAWIWSFRPFSRALDGGGVLFLYFRAWFWFSLVWVYESDWDCGLVIGVVGVLVRMGSLWEGCCLGGWLLGTLGASFGLRSWVGFWHVVFGGTQRRRLRTGDMRSVVGRSGCGDVLWLVFSEIIVDIRSSEVEKGASG